jgi:hypothetical protein
MLEASEILERDRIEKKKELLFCESCASDDEQ